MKIMVENMSNGHGNTVPNQFIIRTKDGVYFQSYSTMIAFIPKKGPVQLDMHNWQASKTTGKYRNLFLGETGAETARKIQMGEYILTDLNKR